MKSITSGYPFRDIGGRRARLVTCRLSVLKLLATLSASTPFSFTVTEARQPFLLLRASLSATYAITLPDLFTIIDTL